MLKDTLGALHGDSNMHQLVANAPRSDPMLRNAGGRGDGENMSSGLSRAQL
jgi:hypothetical protein